VIILGIDPGSLKTGWGVIRLQGNRLSAVEFGVIRMKSTQPFDERLSIIAEGIGDVLRRQIPDSAAMEGIFQSTTKNMQSALKLGQARGAALVTVSTSGLRVAEYPPAEVKKALTGSGRADKVQVREMVRGLLGIRGAVPEDAADALAVAVCHAFRASAPVLGRRT
jgi:crossover junction endodeoxyribonuclease RuvC